MSLLDRLLPPRCLLCGDPGHDGLELCRGCRGDLVSNDHACARCAEPLPATAGALPELRVCGGCLWRPPVYSAIHVPLRYEAPLSGLIHQLKFRGDLAAGRLLGQLLAAAVAPALPPVTAIVPVPLHPRRLRERGYNQAAELGRPLAKQFGVPIAHGALQRHGSTTPQMELPAQQRQGNVKQAFAPGRRVPQGHLLLVDDVVTTASTVRAAAAALAVGDQRQVTVCALARA